MTFITGDAMSCYQYATTETLITTYEINGTRYEKSLMFKYGRMQRKIPPWLVCGSHGACLDSMGSSHRWAGIFSSFK